MVGLFSYRAMVPTFILPRSVWILELASNSLDFSQRRFPRPTKSPRVGPGQYRAIRWRPKEGDHIWLVRRCLLCGYLNHHHTTRPPFSSRHHGEWPRILHIVLSHRQRRYRLGPASRRTQLFGCSRCPGMCPSCRCNGDQTNHRGDRHIFHTGRG